LGIANPTLGMAEPSRSQPVACPCDWGRIVTTTGGSPSARQITGGGFDIYSQTVILEIRCNIVGDGHSVADKEAARAAGFRCEFAGVTSGSLLKSSTS